MDLFTLGLIFVFFGIKIAHWESWQRMNSFVNTPLFYSKNWNLLTTLTTILYPGGYVLILLSSVSFVDFLAKLIFCYIFNVLVGFIWLPLMLAIGLFRRFILGYDLVKDSVEKATRQLKVNKAQ